MSKEKTKSGGVGFLGLLTIAFIVLKLTDVIDWSWWWVLSPVWMPFSVWLTVGGCIVAFAFIKVQFFSTDEQKEQMKRIKADINQQRLNAGKSKWQLRIEQMQEAQKVAQLCKDLPGKRAIHSITNISGQITSVKPDGEGNDVWVVLENGKIGGHRHYFYIEGERGTGGELFEKYKHLHFK